MSTLILTGLVLLVLARPVYAVIRFARLPRAAKRNYPAALWAKVRWRWLTRNLGLAYLDQHRKALKPVPFGTSVKVSGPQPAKLRFPRAKIRPDSFGLVAAVKTVPKTGRAEFEDNAEHIANAWRCHRVQVSQPKPGRLIVRGLRTDPLTLPFGADEAPPGVYVSTSEQGNSYHGNHLRSANRHHDADSNRERVTDLRLYLGVDEWGAHRWLTLPGLTGITVGGLPGFGKTSLINSWLMQLAGLPVQFCLIDLKGGGDFTDWADRAWIYTGDELPAAAAALEDVHSLMRQRLTHAGVSGPRNRWHVGPTDDWPLIVTVIDECHGAFDLEAVKNDKKAEAHVRTCRTLAGQLIKKGRSVLMLTILISQKQDGSAVPTALRDNCGFGLSFAVKTRDAAVCALGDHIRDYPGVCPTTLQDPSYVGVCTAALRTGQDPFVRLRVPEITEEAAAARAAETACKRLDPSTIPTPAPVPADASTALSATAAEPVSS